MPSLEVLSTPAEFTALAKRDLSDTICVVFDVLRATSSMVAALTNGAAAIIPIEEIPDALARRQKNPDVLLAGERNGLRILAELTGGVDFDLGNSPREFNRERVAGKTIVMTTTNGTRALRACAHAHMVLAASFLNLTATAAFIQARLPRNVLLIGAGTINEAAYEDVLGAGAMCSLLEQEFSSEQIADSAHVAREIFQFAKPNPFDAVQRSRNGRRLLAIPDLREDVRFCLQQDISDVVAVMNGGLVTTANL
jgi:2-phosphosulfolactate phosphatase